MVIRNDPVFFFVLFCFVFVVVVVVFVCFLFVCFFFLGGGGAWHTCHCDLIRMSCKSILCNSCVRPYSPRGDVRLSFLRGKNFNVAHCLQTFPYTVVILAMLTRMAPAIFNHFSDLGWQCKAVRVHLISPHTSRLIGMKCDEALMQFMLNIMDRSTDFEWDACNQQLLFYWLRQQTLTLACTGTLMNRFDLNLVWWKRLLLKSAFDPFVSRFQVTRMQESNSFCADCPTKYSLDLDEIWKAVETCWCDEFHYILYIYFVRSIF